MFSMKIPKQELEGKKLMQGIYMPAQDLIRATRGNSYARLVVVAVSAPDRICGQARRIGYVSRAVDALAMYRLKIEADFSSSCSPRLVTLPGCFVLEHRIFCPLPSL